MELNNDVIATNSSESKESSPIHAISRIIDNNNKNDNQKQREIAKILARSNHICFKPSFLDMVEQKTLPLTLQTITTLMATNNPVDLIFFYIKKNSKKDFLAKLKDAYKKSYKRSPSQGTPFKELEPIFIARIEKAIDEGEYTKEYILEIIDGASAIKELLHRNGTIEKIRGINMETKPVVKDGGADDAALVLDMTTEEGGKIVAESKDGGDLKPSSKKEVPAVAIKYTADAKNTSLMPDSDISLKDATPEIVTVEVDTSADKKKPVIASNVMKPRNEYEDPFKDIVPEDTSTLSYGIPIIDINKFKADGPKRKSSSPSADEAIKSVSLAPNPDGASTYNPSIHGNPNADPQSKDLTREQPKKSIYSSADEETPGHAKRQTKEDKKPSQVIAPPTIRTPNGTSSSSLRGAGRKRSEDNVDSKKQSYTVEETKNSGASLAPSRRSDLRMLSTNPFNSHKRESIIDPKIRNTMRQVLENMKVKFASNKKPSTAYSFIDINHIEDFSYTLGQKIDDFHCSLRCCDNKQDAQTLLNNFSESVNELFLKTEIGKYTPAKAKAYNAIIAIFRGFFRLFHMLLNFPYYGFSAKTYQESTNPVAQKLTGRDNFFGYSNAKVISKELRDFYKEFEVQFQEIQNYINKLPDIISEDDGYYKQSSAGASVVTNRF